MTDKYFDTETVGLGGASGALDLLSSAPVGRRGRGGTAGEVASLGVVVRAIGLLLPRLKPGSKPLTKFVNPKSAVANAMARSTNCVSPPLCAVALLPTCSANAEAVRFESSPPPPPPAF